MKILSFTTLMLLSIVFFAFKDISLVGSEVGTAYSSMVLAEGQGISDNNANEDNQGKGTDGNEGNGLGNNDDGDPPTADELSANQMMVIGLVLIGVSLFVYRSKPQAPTPSS